MLYGQHVRFVLAQATFIYGIIWREKSTEWTNKPKKSYWKTYKEQFWKFLTKKFFESIPIYVTLQLVCVCAATAFSAPLMMCLSLYFVFMERYLTLIGKVFWLLAVSHAVHAGSRQVAAALSFTVAITVVPFYRPTWKPENFNTNMYQV